MPFMGCGGSKATQVVAPQGASPADVKQAAGKVTNVTHDSAQSIGQQGQRGGGPTGMGGPKVDQGKVQAIINQSEFEEAPETFQTMSILSGTGDSVVHPSKPTTPPQKGGENGTERMPQQSFPRIDEFEDEPRSAGRQQTQQQQQQAVDPNDPWASLQAAYRIKDAAAPTAGSSGRNLAASSSKNDSGRSTRQQASNAELFVLDDDPDEFSYGRKQQRQSKPSALGPGRPPASAKHGGWGDGEMAAAGTLMLGADEDYLLKDPPKQAAQGGRQQLSLEDEYAELGLDSPAAGKQQRGGGGGGSQHQPKGNVDEFMVQDIEDMDALLEDEMQNQGLGNNDLDAKLRALEAQYDD